MYYIVHTWVFFEVFFEIMVLSELILNMISHRTLVIPHHEDEEDAKDALEDQTRPSELGKALFL